MNDFAGVLIERERGTVSAVVPRLPSLYEPHADGLPADPVAVETEEAGVDRDEMPHDAPQLRDADRGEMQRHAPQPRDAFERITAPTDGRLDTVQEAGAPAGPIPVQSTGAPDAWSHDAPVPEERAAETAPVAGKAQHRQPDPSAVAPRMRAIETDDIAPTREPGMIEAKGTGIAEPQRPQIAVRAGDNTAAMTRSDGEPTRQPRASDPAPRDSGRAEPIPVPERRATAVTAARRGTEAATRALPAVVTVARLNPNEIVPAPAPDADRDAALANEPGAATPVPTIHVSIGRVEIRATPASAARPTRAPAQPMSLEEYLSRRSQRGQP